MSDIESRRSLIFYPMRKRDRSRLNIFPESNSFRITPKKSIIAEKLHKLLFVPQPTGIDTLGSDLFQLAAKDVSTCRV